MEIKAHIGNMDQKHPKRPRDLNQWAKRIVDLATGASEESPKTANVKKAKAGRKGASARKKALTPEQRSEIASVAAQARWKKG